MRRLALAASLVLLASAAAAQPAQVPTPAAPATPTWLPRGTAELQALDKVNARAATIDVKVGATARFGSLTIAVGACVVHPPDQSQDAAAWLDVTDQHAGAPGFKGWMLQSDPSVSMIESPIYDLRVLGCGA